MVTLDSVFIDTEAQTDIQKTASKVNKHTYANITIQRVCM